MKIQLTEFEKINSRSNDHVPFKGTVNQDVKEKKSCKIRYFLTIISLY